MANPDPQRLAILTELRQAAHLTLSDMARRCGLQGRQSHQTVGAWELGNMRPNARRRIYFLGYLWDDLGLRRDPAHFERIWAILVEEWDWEPIGDQEWRQLTSQPRPGTRAHQAPHTSAPSLPIATAVPFQAPPITAHFVGRTAILQQMITLFSASTPPRSVALVGMGGIGKTTLAIHLAHALQPYFADGILWAQTAISTPLDILQSWARAFGYDYSELHDVESCAASLRSALAGRQILFVFDNVESAQRVKGLFVGREQSTVLLTTRSEDVAVALGAQPIFLAELSSAESAQLLINLLGAERVANEAAAAAQIGALLHHLPLAVEIVGQLLASRSRRPLAQMAQRLQDVEYRLDLQISDRDVRTSFLVSWEALDGEQQRLFTHLAVFAGRSFTVQALAALLDEDEDTLLDQLDLLVARSLVKEGGGDRYIQHPLLADFAREQLGDVPDVWTRYAESQLTFARAHQIDYAALEPEWDNIMAGMETAHRLRSWRVVVDYAEVLGDNWFMRAEYTRARQGYAWAVDGAKQLQTHATLASYLVLQAKACIEQNDYSSAESLLAQAKREVSTVSDLGIQSDILLLSGRIALEKIQHDAAERDLLQAYQIKLQIGNDSGAAYALFLLADIPYYQGDYEKARHFGEHAMALQRKIKDELGLVRTFGLIAQIAIVQERFEEALSYCHQALSLCDELGEVAERAYVLYNLAEAERGKGQYGTAQRYIEESLKAFAKIGYRYGEALALRRASVLNLDLENYHAALENALESLRIIDAIGLPWSEVYGRHQLGDIYFRLGQITEAKTQWSLALTIAKQVQHPLVDKLDEKLNVVK